MEVVGKVKVIEEKQVFDSGFEKQVLVVTTDETYPQMIAIEFLKDKTELLASYVVGDNVKVSINLGGREWVNPEGVAKYFNSVTGWRIDKLESVEPEVGITDNMAMTEVSATEPDDLPF